MKGHLPYLRRISLQLVAACRRRVGCSLRSLAGWQTGTVRYGEGGGTAGLRRISFQLVAEWRRRVGCSLRALAGWQAGSVRYGGADPAIILTLVLALSLLAVLQVKASEIEITPTHLELNTMLNDPKVLRLDVSSTHDLEGIDLAADGVSIQREIKQLAPNRVRFLIEPAISTAGRVSGMIAVVDQSGTALAQAQITGEVKPYVRVSPSRLFLGSLEYGTKSDHVFEKRFRLSADGSWAITEVDVSEIENASYTITELADGTHELVVRFPEDALKKGEPFGAFINRSIKIGTNIPAQPAVSIPVTAMLSRNGTDRDFNTFVFHGNERWQGKWATPNIAAAVLGPLILLAIGYGVWLTGLRGGLRMIWRVTGALLLICALVGMVLLVKTYSRGGWLAFAVGLTAMLFIMRGLRYRITAVAILFVLTLLASPAGIQRVRSSSEVTEDASIRNRLLVWRGALEMIYDRPLTGVGAGRFCQTFENFHQEPWHKGFYATAINDYLTLSAEHGVIWMLPLASIAAFFGAVTVQLSRRYEDHWVAPIIAGLVTLATSAMFSSIQFMWEVRIVAVLSAILLIAYCTTRGLRSRGEAFRCNVWVIGVAAAVTVAFVGAGVVFFAQATRSVRYSLSNGVGIWS